MPGRDSAADDIERPYEPATLPADDLRGRDRCSFAVKRYLGAAPLGDMPSRIVYETVPCRGQRVSDRSQTIQRDVSGDDTGTRLLELVEELTIGTRHRGAPARVRIGDDMPRRRYERRAGLWKRGRRREAAPAGRRAPSTHQASTRPR